MSEQPPVPPESSYPVDQVCRARRRSWPPAYRLPVAFPFRALYSGTLNPREEGTKTMKRSIAVFAIGALAAAVSIPALAQDKDTTRADNELTAATEVITQLTGPQSRAGIPDDVLSRAKCVAVI